MSASLLMERLQFIKVLDPVANAFAATPTTEVVNMSKFSRIVFVVHIGVGAAGTSTFTVEACDDVVPSTQVAVAHTSRAITTGDTEGALTARAAAGHIPAAQTSQILLFEVSESALAASGYSYVRLKAVESNAAAVLGGILAIGEAKVISASKATAIV